MIRFLKIFLGISLITLSLIEYCTSYNDFCHTFSDSIGLPLFLLPLVLVISLLITWTFKDRT